MISPSFGKTMIEILTKTTDNYGPRELCIKTIQNVTIFLSDQTKKKNEKLSKKAKAISFSCRDARIAYSFPKICKAIAGLHNISQKFNTMTPYAATLAKFDMGVFASQITFLLFQNSSLLARLGVMDKKKAGFYTKMFGAFWTVYILIVSSKKYYELKHLAPSKDEEKNKMQKKILTLEMISPLFDIPNAFGGSGIPKLLTGWTFSDTMKGVGCTIAASMSMYAYKLRERSKPKL